MKYRIIVLDLDGTLTNRDKEIRPEQKKHFLSCSARAE